MIDAILNFEFIRYSFISGILIGLIAPLIGTFIVVRRLSLIADALSHVTLGGISFGMFLITLSPLFAFVNPIWTGILFAIIGALLIEYLRTSYKNYQEIAIPIIMSTGICLSAIFISLAKGFNQELVGLLFGSISAVSISDLITIVTISVLVLAFIMLFYKELFILSFDTEYSQVIGIPKWIQFLFIVIVALVISASMRVIGVLLVSALITLPVAIAMRWTKGFKQFILISIIIGEFSVIVGLVTAFYLNISPGGIIVVILVIMLGLTLFYQSFVTGKLKGVKRNENGRSHSYIEK
ncbi:metal ABC transporter permease [Staphylococcus pseudintermedius]